MLTHIKERIAYGRSIRNRTACMLEAHGDTAAEVALTAAGEPGLSEAERYFWQAVADRAARLNAAADAPERAA